MQQVVGAGIMGTAVTNVKRLTVARPPGNPKVIRMWYETLYVRIKGLLTSIEILDGKALAQCMTPETRFGYSHLLL